MLVYTKLKRVAVITGDIHHPPDFVKQLYYRRRVADCYEAHIAQYYLKILKDFDMCATLFATAILVNKCSEIVLNLIKNFNVELGMHGTYAFRGLLWGYTTLITLYKKLFDSPYGPKILVRHDVFRAINIFKKVGIEARIWRTHGYQGNKYLYNLLARLGFRAVSDGRSKIFKIEKQGPLFHVYINMPVDDSLPHLSYDERKRWYSKYLKLLRSKIDHGEPLVLQLHPVNMALDGFEFFIEVLEILKKRGYEILKLTELIEVVEKLI